MAYQADIVIAVKGATQLTNLQRQIEATSASINKVNKQLASQGLLGNTISNLQKVVTQSSQAMRSASTGTTAQKQAIDTYVKSLVQAEKAEQNLALAIKKRQQELGIATAKTTQASGKGFGGRVSGALANAAIGGAFPLLFGQGGGAAFGGAVGGLVGGAFGGVGGFAGSLVGTLLGDIASRGQAVKQLADDIGFSAQQTKQLSDAFKIANTDVEKFTAVIQNIRGVGLEIEDQAKAIQLVTRLTELYGGSFEKTGNAITSALESGKVTQATLNQLTSQGITIQDALAKKYGVSRDAILKMAKDGNITVQTLIDTLVQLGNEGEIAAKKPKTAFEQFITALGNTGTAIANLATQIGKTLGPALDAILLKATTVLNAINQALAAGNISVQQKQAAKGRAEQIVQNQAGFLPGGPFGAGSVTVKYGQKTYKGAASSVVSQITNDLINAEVQKAAGAPAVTRPPIPTFTAPSQAPAAPDKAADKAARDAARLAEQRQKQLEVAARMAVLTEGELQKSVAVTEQEKINTDYAQQRMERMVKYETLYKEALSSAEIEYLLMAQSNEILAENVNYQKDLLDIALAQSEVINKADPLASAQQDLELLAAKIQGKEKEYLVQKQINDLIKQGAAPEDAQGLILTIQDLEKQNKAIETQKQLWADIYTTVAGEIQNAITGLIKGTAEWGDILSSILGSLGNLFLNAAFTGLGGALKLPGFASGGFVTSPTTAVVGEGGEPEYVIPASKMRTAMGRYSAGARGSSVVSGNGGPISSENGGGVATMEPIDVRYSIERINNVDYVTADQFQRGLAQAAQQGAIQGERRAMRSLKNSAATRRGVGI